jgi:hypothetical protein
LKNAGEAVTEAQGMRMPFTIEEFCDLVRILEEKLEWRPDLRRLALADELLSLLEQVAKLSVYRRRRSQELANTQTRTGVAELARTKHVWQIMDGYTFAPELAASPS